MLHMTTAERPEFGLRFEHQAECTECGWKGPVRSDREQHLVAQDAADHQRSVGAG
jgi:hypothetical protein